MIGNNIKKVRELRNYSINSLAKKCSISAGYLSDLEKNKKENPSISTLQKIANALNVTLDKLLENNEILKNISEPTEKTVIPINNKDGILTVTSRQIAHDFGKEHYNVIRDIENILNQLKIELVAKYKNNSSQNWIGYFIPTEYRDSKGEMRKEYLLTRDGFSLLVMGFTGRQALQWKLKYIEAFNKMETFIKKNTPSHTLTEIIKLIRETRSMMKEQGCSPRDIAIAVKQICDQNNVKLL